MTWGGNVAELSKQQSISWSCPFDFKVGLFEVITVAPRASRTQVLKRKSNRDEAIVWHGLNQLIHVTYQVNSES